MADDIEGKIVGGNFLAYGAVTLTLSAVKGFLDETGFNSSNYLFFTVPAIHAIMGVFDGVGIAKKGRQITGNYPYIAQDMLEEYLQGSEGKLRSVIGGYMGGFGEGLMGAVEMGVGYIIGRYLGYKSKSS